MKSLYQRLKDAGCKIENHYSDLYVESTETARKIINEYKKENGLSGSGLCSSFISQIDGKPWLDLPFFFEPYWQSKQKESV